MSGRARASAAAFVEARVCARARARRLIALLTLSAARRSPSASVAHAEDTNQSGARATWRSRQWAAETMSSPPPRSPTVVFVNGVFAAPPCGSGGGGEIAPARRSQRRRARAPACGRRRQRIFAFRRCRDRGRVLKESTGARVSERRSKKWGKNVARARRRCRRRRRPRLRASLPLLERSSNPACTRVCVCARARARVQRLRLSANYRRSSLSSARDKAAGGGRRRRATASPCRSRLSPTRARARRAQQTDERRRARRCDRRFRCVRALSLVHNCARCCAPRFCRLARRRRPFLRLRSRNPQSTRALARTQRLLSSFTQLLYAFSRLQTPIHRSFRQFRYAERAIKQKMFIARCAVCEAIVTIKRPRRLVGSSARASARNARNARSE